MKYSLRAKLSLSYIFVVLVSVGLIMILANVFLEGQFKEYVRQNQEQQNRQVVSAIAQQFTSDGKWNAGRIETIGINALENGQIIRVKDAAGTIIWDATEHNNGMCQRIIEHMSHNMSSRYPGINGTYTEVPYPVLVGSVKAGTVEIGSYGPFYLDDNDLAFVNTLNVMLISAGGISLLLALVLGIIMARQLSLPIARVTANAEKIAHGDFSGRLSDQSSTTEIDHLTAAINDLADALQKQENLRKRMTGDVAHELRTPLATLQSHLEAMIDGVWPADRERLMSCHEEILRINRMVGELEKLARYERENMVLDKTVFNLTELISHIIHNFEGEYLNKGLSLGLEAEDVSIEADSDKISQVIVNLMSNALKYTRQGGSVDIGVKKGPQGTIRVSVRDNGQGISEEDLPYIFERFYRADKSRNRMTGGAGIGLTVARAIVEAHKGKIEVRSTPGQGSEFIVTLPEKHSDQ